MPKDVEEVIEEIRASRREMSALCGHDPRKLLEYLKQFNKKYSGEVQRYERLGRSQPQGLTPGSNLD